MSLINQMLRDLEARQHGQPGSHPPVALYHDLEAVPRPAARRSRVTVVLALAAALAVLAAFAGWRYGMRPDGAPVAGPAPRSDAAANGSVASTVVEPAPPAPSARARPLPAERPAGALVPPADGGRAAGGRPAPVAQPQSGGDITKVAQPPSPQELAASAYQQAVDAIRTGRSREAEELLRRAVELDARHTAAREALVGLLLQQGHGSEALALLEEGIELTPQYYRFAQLAARLAVEQGAEARALALLERGAAHARPDPAYQAFYAALLQRAGRHEEAARNFQQALEQRPLESRWWLGLAISLESQQRWSAAADAYRRSLQGAGLDAGLRKFAEQRLAGVKSGKD